MLKSPAAYFFWAALRESVLDSTTRWGRMKFKCSLTKFPARPSPTPNMRLLSTMEVTSGESYGLMQDGAGVKLPAQAIRATGGLSMANCGVEIFMKWFRSQILFLFCKLIGKTRLHAAH